MPYVAFRSAQFPHAYLRMDGTGVTKPTDDGGGKVNCQAGIGPYEVFEVIDNDDKTKSFKSVSFDNVFLRLDGRSVHGFTGPGGGVVNCQFGHGPFEKFNLVPGYEKPGTHAIASHAFQNIFLRMDGSGVDKFEAGGSGTVNCQFGKLQYETFEVIDIYGDPKTWKL